jgi:serine/threonine protein kinase
MIGRAISHYRVLETLGAGGMGVVYLAEDGRLGRQVALKFLPPEASRDETTLERFRLEARAASSLSHPGICTVFDIGDDGGSPFIVMEALKGETLRDRIKRAPIKVSDVLDLAIQLADALEAAHSQGIVHRDIKPGNIFVGDKNRVKILDFGLAKLVQPPDAATMSGDDQLTVPGSTLGTVSYMSPEQARGEEVDARSDLFSLGTVIYEMAAGVQAFGGSSPGAVIAAILIRPAAPIMERNGAIPPRLEEIIQKALEKDRDLRYQHAADLLTDLKRLRRDLEINTSHSSATVLATPMDLVTLAPASRASMAKAASGSRASVAPAEPAGPTSIVPALPAERAPAWRLGVAAGAAVLLVAFGLAWAWRPQTESPAPAPSAQAQAQAPAPTLAPAAGAAAALPATSASEAASRSSAPPGVRTATVPATPPPQTASDVRTSAATGPAAAGSQPITPAAGRAVHLASMESAATPVPPPQIAPAVSAPVLSGVPAANASVPAPPPSAPAPGAPASRATSPAPMAPPAAAESDDAAIRRTLATYAMAVEKKDVSLFRSVRPGLSAAEEGRLRDSFKQIESQQVTLDVEDIRVDGRTATVRLSRKDSLVIAGRRQTQASRQVLRLEKAGADWIISEFR